MNWNATWTPSRDAKILKQRQKENVLDIIYRRVFGKSPWKSPWIRLRGRPRKQPAFALSHYERAELPK